MKSWENRIKSSDFILDIGCWDGALVLELSKKCNNVYGMDINTKRFDLAEKEIRKKLFFGDVTKKIPFKKKFDWIFLSEVLEHVENNEITLKNISNSLKVGGKLILSTPRSVKFFEFWDPAWVRWKFLGGEKHHHFTRKELFKKLEKNNLRVKEFKVRGDILWVICRWTNVILRYLLKIKKQITCKDKKGFCDWVILAEKVK